MGLAESSGLLGGRGYVSAVRHCLGVQAHAYELQDLASVTSVAMGHASSPAPATVWGFAMAWVLTAARARQAVRAAVPVD